MEAWKYAGLLALSGRPFASLVSANPVGLPTLSTLTPASSTNLDPKAIGPSAGSPTYSFTYDAENRQISRVDAAALANQYVYDGEGRRVQASAGSVVNGTFTASSTTTFVYDAFGQMVADYGTPVPSPPCTTCYLSLDHLGSTRMITDQFGNVVARHDYAPFGDELTSGFAGRGHFGARPIRCARSSQAQSRTTGMSVSFSPGITFCRREDSIARTRLILALTSSIRRAGMDMHTF